MKTEIISGLTGWCQHEDHFFSGLGKHKNQIWTLKKNVYQVNISNKQP
jgi:hypothetical protein